MLRIPLTVLCCFVIIGCGAGPTPPSDIPASDLLSAPTHIVADGQGITLTAFLARDFMPIAPPDGRPLGGVLRFKSDDGSRVSSSVIADTGWVVRDGEVWSATVEQQSRSVTAPHYEVVVRNGPKWSPDIAVTVVARLRDSTGRTMLLRASEPITIGIVY
jgi:hypothetical protein